MNALWLLLPLAWSPLKIWKAALDRGLKFGGWGTMLVQLCSPLPAPPGSSSLSFSPFLPSVTFFSGLCSDGFQLPLLCYQGVVISTASRSSSSLQDAILVSAATDQHSCVLGCLSPPTQFPGGERGPGKVWPWGQKEGGNWFHSLRTHRGFVEYLSIACPLSSLLSSCLSVMN